MGAPVGICHNHIHCQDTGRLTTVDNGDDYNVVVETDSGNDWRHDSYHLSRSASPSPVGTRARRPIRHCILATQRPMLQGSQAPRVCPNYHSTVCSIFTLLLVCCSLWHDSRRRSLTIHHSPAFFPCNLKLVSPYETHIVSTTVVSLWLYAYLCW